MYMSLPGEKMKEHTLHDTHDVIQYTIKKTFDEKVVSLQELTISAVSVAFT